MIPSPPANIHYTRSQPTSLATSLPPGSTHFPNSHQSPLPRLNRGHGTNGSGQEVGSGYPVSSSAFLNTGTGDSSHQQGCSKGCRGRRGKPPIPTGTPLGFLGSLTPPQAASPPPEIGHLGQIGHSVCGELRAKSAILVKKWCAPVPRPACRPGRQCSSFSSVSTQTRKAAPGRQGRVPRATDFHPQEVLFVARGLGGGGVLSSGRRLQVAGCETGSGFKTRVMG